MIHNQEEFTEEDYKRVSKFVVASQLVCPINQIIRYSIIARCFARWRFHYKVMRAVGCQF